MTTRQKPQFVTRVREALPRLHPSERRLAEVVLNFPGELASYSATELAKLAHVSNATVTRFVRRLGYASFEDARQDVRADAQSGAALFRVSSADWGGDEAIALHLQQAQLNLRQTFAAISGKEIDAVATAIIEARQVWLLGFRSSLAFARYLGWQVFQVVPQARIAPGAGETLAETVAAMTAEDCVVVFALRRPPAKLPHILREIGQTGARTALVGDGADLPDLPATWRFRCHSGSPGPLFSHVSVALLCHLLATRVIELSGTKGRRRLSAIEGIHDRLDEL